MSLIGLLIVILVICLLLWIVNVSGYLPLPPPMRWIFNGIALVVFIVILLQVAGVSIPDMRVGR